MKKKRFLKSNLQLFQQTLIQIIQIFRKFVGKKILKIFAYILPVSAFNKRKKIAGFTLPELLITIIISSIVTTFLLSAIVQVFQHDRREIALSDTQKDVQRALDFIAEDLRESIFIYSDNDALAPYLPNFGTKPVLIFWKLKRFYNPNEPLAKADNTLPGYNASFTNSCSGFTNGTPKFNECRILLQRRFAASLVVYYQVTTPDPKYPGISRIMRYELPKYKDVSTLTTSTGFVDPVFYNNYAYWPKFITGANLQPNIGGGVPILSDNPPQVLVDYIDDPTVSSPNPLTCPNPPSPAQPIYSRLPADAANFQSFYACVRRPINAVNAIDVGVNQDVIIFLRGSAVGRNGVIKEDRTINAAYNAAAATPTQQIRVTLRGIVDKFK